MNDFFEQVHKQAIQYGFSDCEVYIQQNQQSIIVISGGEISSMEQSDVTGIRFRGTYQGRTGYAYTENPEHIHVLLWQAKENALLLPDNQREYFVLPQRTVPIIKHKHLPHHTIEEQMVWAKKLCFAPEYIDFCRLCTERTKIQILNSYGLSLCHTQNSISAFVRAIAQRGEERQTATTQWSGVDDTQFSPIELTKTAIQHAKQKLGAHSLPSGASAMILDGKVAANLLSCFADLFFAENVQKGISLFSEKEGTYIASDCITLSELPLLSDGIKSRPFDDEGIYCFDKIVIKNGILQTLLYTQKSAKRANTVSTGNGFQSSPTAPIETGVTNFQIACSEIPLSALFTKIQNGIYITEVSGLHAGTNIVSGSFSLLAEGFLIEEGKQTQPIEQITISGNFYTLLKQIQAVSDKAYVLPSGISSPAWYVYELVYAGNGGSI